MFGVHSSSADLHGNRQNTGLGATLEINKALFILLKLFVSYTKNLLCVFTSLIGPANTNPTLRYPMARTESQQQIHQEESLCFNTQQDNERQHPTTTNFASGPNTSAAEVTLSGTNRRNSDTLLVQRVTLYSAAGLAGVLLWQFLILGPEKPGWLIEFAILALVLSWLWGVHTILSSPSKGKLVFLSNLLVASK